MSQAPEEAPETNASQKPEPLPTIWNVPDDLWEMIQRILEVYDPPNKMGRPRIDQRKALDGILYRARTGCQWNHLPKEFGDDVSVHRTLTRWENQGIFDILWAVLLTRCEALRGVEWDWQAADCALGKARGVGKKGHRKKTKSSKSGDATPTNASAPTRPTVVTPRGHPGSRRACLSREQALRLGS
jgi:transposase